MSFNKLKKSSIILLGLAVKIIALVVRPNKDYWVFGAGKGEDFIDNSKFLFLHVAHHNRKIHPIWITTNKRVISQLRTEGYECYHNYSAKGIFSILKAGVGILCTNRSDIHFFQPSKDKILVNLFHGMPIKKIIYDFEGHNLKRNPFYDKIWNVFAATSKWEDSRLIPSTAEFFNESLSTAFKTENVYVTGLPRNDIFFYDTHVKEKFKGIDNHKKWKLSDKRIVSYLPTHRKFGKGKINPIPFIDDQEMQDFLSNANTILLYKAHYNYAIHKDRIPDEKSVMNISHWDIDTQYLLKISDVLITDYSSCLFDFLLLDRPILLYFYDNYAIEDNHLYFDIEDPHYAPGPIIRNQKELKRILVGVIETGDPFRQKRQKFVQKYHKFRDGKSSLRIVESINNILSDRGDLSDV
ncbi:MAG: CDP-glycerol glycerophosphotransferase family protein [Candidatus Marinimicrobia bacterium]|nr:CDP-glycerol glycerophosphotransferase family protein [Candidatus Neomarinimicrobiota bacterium]MCF7828788.1 CDP-glycerol glycerophosphotransferase family protein [Candidatus Neomarinimicrobiota bacterium]MCF7880705.1 CDP-glycerol glycerophosphotransferase family protein [Candidatus Neomarinimicrobiota bacterium]